MLYVRTLLPAPRCNRFRMRSAFALRPMISIYVRRKIWQSDSQWEIQFRTSALTRASAQTRQPRLQCAQAQSPAAHQPERRRTGIAKGRATHVVLFRFLFEHHCASMFVDTAQSWIISHLLAVSSIIRKFRAHVGFCRWSHLEPAFLGISKAAVTMRRAAAR